MKKVTLLVAAALLAAMPAFGAQLLNEPFSYPDGDLTTVSGGVWVAHSGAGNKPIQVTSGTIRLEQSGGSGEDVHTAFAQQPVNSKTYACFNLIVEGPGFPAISSNYFAHFRTDGNFNFRARTFVTPATAGGDFTVGIDTDDSSVDAVWGTDLSYLTPYRIVISYDDATNTAELWVDPVSEASAKIVSSDGAVNVGVDALDRFSFRQDSVGETWQIIDDLTVGQAFADVCDGATPTSTSSWGRLKTLYR